MLMSVKFYGSAVLMFNVLAFAFSIHLLNLLVICF